MLIVVQEAACHGESRTIAVLSTLAGFVCNDEAEKDKYEIQSGRDFQNTEFLFYAVSFSGMMMSCLFHVSFSVGVEQGFSQWRYISLEVYFEDRFSTKQKRDRAVHLIIDLGVV